MSDKINEKDTEQFSKDVEVIISPAKLMLIKFKNNPLAMIGLWGLIVIITVVVATHFYTEIINYNFSYTDADMKFIAPSFQHPFGTDQYGRDLLVRVFEGGWISLSVGVISTLMSVIIGLLLGAIAGYFGGRIDSIIMRITEIVYSFPFLALAFIVASMFRDKPSKTRLFYIIILLGFINWTGLARMIRGQILSLREQEFMVATKALGIKTKNQILRHLIPNVLPMVVVSGTMTFAFSILGEASLSFLNLSVTEPVPTWGALLSKAASNSYNLREYWWIWVFAGTALFLFIMSINLVGEGLREATDPKSEYMTKAQRKAKRTKRRAERNEEKSIKKGVA